MGDFINFKESPLKMLLTSPTGNSGNITPSVTTSVPQINIISSVQNVPSPITDLSDDGSIKLITYYNQFAASGEKELDPVLMDHCYSRPWNWRPETSFIRPTKTLFVPKNHPRSNNSLPVQRSFEDRDVIDVERVTPPPIPIYDRERAKLAMDECERHAALARPTDTNDDWEESVSRVNWTTTQTRVFTSVVKILNSDRMARLTYSGSWNEPIQRRAVVDKSMQRFRSLMASVAWDIKITQWLHTLLIDHLSTAYLGAYLDILQSLKSKLPSFVDKMMFGPNCMSRIGPTSSENLFPLLKKPWDPVANGVLLDRPRKLPGNPIFIVAPGATSPNAGHSKSLHKWMKLLSSLAQVVSVHTNLGQTCLRMNMTNCADHLFNATRAKLQEVRNEFPGRPIVLVGFNTGSAVVCQVAEVEYAVAAVCLGFPLLTAEGRRGEPDDYLLDLQYPVLFVIGQNSHRTSREDMEDLRERMRVETGLVVVGSADDYLRISKSKRRQEGITQSIVDRCILDEIGEFVGSILLSPFPPQTRPQSNYATEQYTISKHLKSSRVRNNSNGSSIESEPPSPQPHPQPRTRPVGRPPGSGRRRQQGLPPYKSDVFRAAHSAEALNRAVQSITPTVQQLPAPAPQPMGVVTSRSIMTTGSTLSNLLQSGLRPSTAGMNTRPMISSSSSGASGLKILENITVSSSVASKLLSNSSGRPVTLLNTVGGNINRTGNLDTVVLLPDGTKYIRSVGGPSTVLTTMQNRNANQLQPQKQQILNQGITKLVPTRRQIITKSRAPPESTLTAPANLTTADIMDLPIIFADDNSSIMPESNVDDSSSQIVLAPKKPTPNKLVVINKQVGAPSTQNHPQQNVLKRAAPSVPNRAPGQPVKFAKIIVTKKGQEDSKPQTIMPPNARFKPNEITTISPKKYDHSSFEHFDLEAELKATAVPKPIHTTLVNAHSIKNKPEIKQVGPANKKATINIDGRMTNVTLRVPVNFNSRSGNSATPTRYVYTEASNNSDNTTHVVLNRTITGQNKDHIKTMTAENFTFRYENITKSNDD